jgi:hypothetical protein
MRLAHLRTQMLIAMGLPACWTGPTPAPQPPAPPTAKVHRDFEAASCVRDSIPETICGERRQTARTCGTHATNLGSVDETKLYVTVEDDPASAYRAFVFDRDATRTYREDQDAGTRSSHCCYSQCTALTLGAPEPIALTGGARLGTKCMPAPPNGTSRPAKEDGACPEAVLLEGAMRPYVSTDEGNCCYSIPVRFQIHSIPGRALRIDGVPHVAAVARREGWSAAIAPNLELDPVLRARLADAWLGIARLEHASIAAFASLAVRLVAAGAPVDLLAQTHAAALDEVRHAQLAFALASAYAGTAFGPGAFEAATRAATDGDLRSLALETFTDGCIGETAAAYHAELAAAAACDPEVAQALAQIAEDEARHGALAWAIVAWCVREGAVSIAELTQLASSVPSVVEANEDLLEHGILGDRAAATARADVVRDVVLPCLQSLAA